MTHCQRCQSLHGLPRRTVTMAILAALSMAICDAAVLARPRTWADQDVEGVRQPSWMPFSMSGRTPNPAVARITAVEGGSLSQGSGTLVDVRGQRGLMVTNWHVIRDANGPIVVTFPDGFRSAATVLKVDPEWDLAALLIWRPTAAPITISTTAPRPGDPLLIAGYGSGNYRAVAGRCTQYVAPGAHMPYEMVEVSAEARQGDSGGPILNERGELAGVLFGAGDGTTSGSFCGRVRWFLDSAWLSEPSPSDEAFVSALACQPNTRWPSDSLLAVPHTPTATDHYAIEPTPIYSIGSPLAPATISANQLHDSGNAMNFKRLTGANRIEQAKSILAAIGILAIFLQGTRVVRGSIRNK